MTDVLAPAVRRRTRRARRRRRPFVPAALALAFLVALATSALGGRMLLHRGEALPGVRLLGTDVSGLDRHELAVESRRLLAARLAEPVELAVAERSVRVAPKLLFTLDRPATVAALHEAGRESWQARARAAVAPVAGTAEVAPVLRPRPAAERRLTALLARFAHPPVSARVELRGSEPVVLPGKAGSAPVLGELLTALERRVAAGSGTVPVRFAPAEPAVGVAEAERAAERARLLLSAPVELTREGEAAGRLLPGRLARLLGFRERGERLLLALDEQRLARVLDPAVAPFKRRAVNAQFAVEGERVRIVPSRTGLGLDAKAVAAAVLEAGSRSTDRTAALRLAPVPPDRTTAEAKALGIRERLSSFTTEMGPSSANRIHNVHLMAEYIDGTIVTPGQTFSFNGTVGPRTPERGFLEGQMIVGSLLLPSIGGGVCQTATTLFNNAFELGLPIAERHNHSFYISHYPLGRDATVSWGGPDFAFRNDMEHALLIKTSYTDATLTFSFYGTDEGRRVVARTGPKSNWKEPTLTYARDPAAPAGSMRVERGERQSGFDVTVYRTVTRRGKTLRRDSFPSRYIPVGDTAIYGPGREIPGPYFTIPAT